jgi:hypothetical protein
VTELDDIAELLLDLTLEEDFAELQLVTAASEPPSPCFLLDEDPSSQSSHTLDDDPSEGRIAKLLSSSLHATSIAAHTRTPNQRERIFPPNP